MSDLLKIWNKELNSIKHRLPVELVYYEACNNKEDALKREKYLKTAYGKRYLKNRLSDIS